MGRSSGDAVLFADFNSRVLLLRPSGLLRSNNRSPTRRAHLPLRFGSRSWNAGRGRLALNLRPPSLLSRPHLRLGCLRKLTTTTWLCRWCWGGRTALAEDFGDFSESGFELGLLVEE